MTRISAVLELYCWFDERRYALLGKRLGGMGNANSDSGGQDQHMHSASDNSDNVFRMGEIKTSDKNK
jgi:hypothetical protein